MTYLDDKAIRRLRRLHASSPWAYLEAAEELCAQRRPDGLDSEDKRERGAARWLYAWRLRKLARELKAECVSPRVFRS